MMRCSRLLALIAICTTAVSGEDIRQNPGHFEEAVPPPEVIPEAPAAAGGGPAAIVHGRFVSYQVNVDNFGVNILGDAANEPSIAVDPTNTAIMAIGWRDFSTVTNAFRQSGVAHSTDRGETWTFPGVIRPGEFASDPVLEADSAGNFYYYSLQPNRGPGLFACYMYKSTDGGMTWPQDVYGTGGDKAWVAIDRTGGPADGTIYIQWSPNPQAGCCAPATFTHSTDGGLTWLPPVQLPVDQFAGTLDVGPDGEVYTVGNEFFAGFPQRIFVARSSSPSDPAPFFEVTTEVDLDGFRGFSAGPNPGGLIGQVQVAVDHSTGPSRGNVYVLGSLGRLSVSDPSDVMFARSTTRAISFEAPQRLNQDALGGYQWFGTIAVAPNGRIDVVWNDTRNDATPATPTFSELFYTYSLDAGMTWASPEVVTPAFNHFLGYPQQNKLGDYYDMVSFNDGAYLAYAATFNGEQDVYFVRLTSDCNSNGVGDDADITAATSGDCNINGIPDECEPDLDCNTNAVQDICDVAALTSDDCNTNLVPDECESDADCNANGIQDICDIGSGTSVDCDRNDVPDECELGDDCNSNGIIDGCDVAAGGISFDCNMNGVPDECDIAAGTSDDDDIDGVPDECIGACCVCGTCVETLAGDCGGSGGTFSGAMTACVDVPCVALSNDDCSTAEVLPDLEQVAVPTDNTCATTDGPASETCEAGAIPVGADQWFSYTSPSCGFLTVSQCTGTLYDGVLAVYDGGASCSCPTDSSTLLACGDDTCGIGGGPGTVTIPVEQGHCYYIRVAGWNGIVGTGQLTVSLDAFPAGAAVSSAPVGHWDVDAGTYTENGSFADVWVDGDIVYQGQVLDNKVHFFDISDPFDPQRFLEWSVPAPNMGASTEDVKVANGLLFIALHLDGFDGVEIVDVRDPASPVHLTWVTVPGFNDVRNLFIDNEYLYLANGTTADLAVVDLSTFDPDAAPAAISSALWTVNAGSSFVEDVVVADGVAYVAAGNDGVWIFDVSDIANTPPVLLGAGPPQAATHSVWPTADGQWVVATELRSGGPVQLYEIVPDGGGVDVVLRQTVALPTTTAISAHHVVVDGERVYATWHEAGLRIFDIDTAGARLIEVGSYNSYYNTPFGSFVGAWGVYPFRDDGIVVISDINSGLHVIRTVEERLTFNYPNGRPDYIDIDAGAIVTVHIDAQCDMPVERTATLYVGVDVADGGSFVGLPMVALGGNLYEASIPVADCGSTVSYYVEIETVTGLTVVDPPGAPLTAYRADVASGRTVLFEDDFEASSGWTVLSQACFDGTATGAWQRVDPLGTAFAPEDDHTPGGSSCYVSGQGPVGGTWFTADIDGGPFQLLSPIVVTGGADVEISYARWFYSILFSAGAESVMQVEVSGDGGSSWAVAETVHSSGAQWVEHSFRVSEVIPPTGSVRLRFTIVDCPNVAIPEAAIDDVSIVALPCAACDMLADCADLDSNGIRDDNCTWWACTDGACAGTDVVFADMGGQFGACPPDGTADGNDRFHALNCFADMDPLGGSYMCESAPPVAFNVDAGGQFGDCNPDGVCDGNDAFAALNAFGGLTSCSCPADGGPAPVIGSPVTVGHASLWLRADRAEVGPGDLLEVEVYLGSDLADLRGFQLHLGVTGGRRGDLQLVDISVPSLGVLTKDRAPIGKSRTDGRGINAETWQGERQTL